MKIKFIHQLLSLMIILTITTFKVSSQTASIPITYSGALALGCSAVCGVDYWCINSTGGCGTASICDSKTFTDPVPTGNLITDLQIKIWTAPNNGSAITAYVNSNVYPTMHCSPDSCVISDSTSDTYTSGMPDYNYGGDNTLQLCCGADVCILQVEITFNYLATGISNIPAESSGLYVYPTLASNNITIETSTQSKDYEISICNLQGQLLLQQPLQKRKADIDISGLAKGMYFLELLSNDKIKVIKFFKE